MNGGLTWSRVLEVPCDELEDAADGWGRLSVRADAARDRIDQQILTGLRETQDGEAADAALERLRQLARNFQYVHTETGLVRTTLNSLSHEVRMQQKVLREALEDAESRRFTVHADGSVSYPENEGLLADRPLPGGKIPAGREFPDLRMPTGTLTVPNPHASSAQDIADRIARAVATAAEADERYARILRDLKAENGLAVPDSMWTDAAADMETVREAARTYLNDRIPYDATAAERKEWWSHLTPELREEYLATYPDVIGNLDGIPALVRDSVNRDTLRLLIGKLEGMGGDEAEEKLEALRLIDEQLQTPLKPGDPPMYLLGIGDEGNGRAIVAYGNPDASKNVAAYVPGLNTGLDEKFVTDDVRRARDTAIGAREIDESSSVMVWLGYDAPQVPDWLNSFDVAGSASAVRGGITFDGFMEGVSVTNENSDPHLTAIGHSYGSRTIGAASQREGGISGVDDIVLVGSPGVGVDHAKDLSVGADHVFVGAADNDVVTKLPSRSEVAASALGFLAGGPTGSVLATKIADPDADEGWFGRDPASAEFGARRFSTSDGPSFFGFGSFAAHSQYFTPELDSKSADNIALIAAGKSEKIKMEEPR